MKRKTNPRKLAAIARAAAKMMEDKKSWCQSSWAKTKQGYCVADLKSFQEESDERSYEERNIVGDNYFAANSPKAQKFCVQGFIYKAAGDAYVTPLRGYTAAQAVIDALDRAIDGDPTTSYTDAMSLNDSNGDASRVKLVEKLREVAKDLA